jgi:RecA-family ATPase
MEKIIEQNNKFIVAKTMNEWIEIANGEPIPKMLFSELWHEGELCILFSSTGLGKSALAMQIADSITSGVNVQGFKLQAEKQKVLYIDFELSNKQLQKRYSNNFENNYIFDNNFIRVKIDSVNIPDGVSYEYYLINEIEKYIIESGVKIIVIDNLTYLKGDVEKAKDALPFMKELNKLKEHFKLSILVLAHTPKRSMYNALTLTDLSGSSALSQFCDSCFAIGKSVKEPKIRYIKQLKQRFTENLYGEDNVIVCCLEQPDNYLHFSYISFGKECDYLQNQLGAEKIHSLDIAKKLKNEGMSYREIAKQFDVSHTTIENWLKNNNDTTSKDSKQALIFNN